MLFFSIPRPFKFKATTFDPRADDWVYLSADGFELDTELCEPHWDCPARDPRIDKFLPIFDLTIKGFAAPRDGITNDLNIG